MELINSIHLGYFRSIISIVFTPCALGYPVNVDHGLKVPLDALPKKKKGVNLHLKKENNKKKLALNVNV